MTKIIRTEKRKRGLFGQIFKWLFIIFNIFMLISLFAGLSNVGNFTQTLHSDLERNAAGAGATIGLGFILVLWAAGDVILGMLAMGEAVGRGRRCVSPLVKCAEIKQTVWKRQRIEDGWGLGEGFGLFAISRQNLLLTSLELPGTH